MVGRLGPNDFDAMLAEVFTESQVLKMGYTYTRAPQKNPSVDGEIQMHDPISRSYLYVAVQVKTGPTYARNFRDPRSSFHVNNLKREDIIAWQASNKPTIIVWVNQAGENCTAWWGDARFAKIGARKLKISWRSVFDARAQLKLLELARAQAGRPSIPEVSSQALFPARVSEVKSSAWQFYSIWRRQGSSSPCFGPVHITLKGWRHLTRVSSSQHEVIHKLALLPLAREVIASAGSSFFLRRMHCDSGIRELHAVRGISRARYRADRLIEVVLDVTRTRGGKQFVRLYGVNERRGW